VSKIAVRLGAVALSAATVVGVGARPHLPRPQRPARSVSRPFKPRLPPPSPSG
jgi:hypothetical protein